MPSTEETSRELHDAKQEISKLKGDKERLVEQRLSQLEAHGVATLELLSNINRTLGEERVRASLQNDIINSSFKRFENLQEVILGDNGLVQRAQKTALTDKHVLDKVEEHELHLRGHNGRGGLLSDMQDIKKNQQFSSKLAWLIVTLVVGLVVHSIWNNYTKTEKQPAAAAAPASHP